MSGTGFVLSDDVFLLEGKTKRVKACPPERGREQKLSSKGGKEEGVM